MPTLRLVLEYDGTDFEGWQAQPEGHRTVQATLERALERVTGRRATLVGAGRTDAGVHAEAQVASGRIETRVAPSELQRALNAVLPLDVAVRTLEPVVPEFHARRDARAKRYEYRLWNAPVRSPLRERRFAWLRRPLDLAAMRQAAESLIGTRDFASFASAGSCPRSTVRTLNRLEIEGGAGGEVRIVVEGNGFLRHMVRNLVGTLVEVGTGRRRADSMEALLASRDRSQAGATAPARGLTLLGVRYPEGWILPGTDPSRSGRS